MSAKWLPLTPPSPYDGATSPEDGGGVCLLVFGVF
jgi:hypothetical protein